MVQERTLYKLWHWAFEPYTENVGRGVSLISDATMKDKEGKDRKLTVASSPPEVDVLTVVRSVIASVLYRSGLEGGPTRVSSNEIVGKGSVE